MLFGISAANPLVYLSMSLLLALVALLAVAVPVVARRPESIPLAGASRQTLNEKLELQKCERENSEL